MTDDLDCTVAPRAIAGHYYDDDRPDYLAGRSWPTSCSLSMRVLETTGVTVRIRAMARGVQVTGLGETILVGGVGRTYAAGLAIRVADWLDDHDAPPSSEDLDKLRTLIKRDARATRAAASA